MNQFTKKELITYRNRIKLAKDSDNDILDMMLECDIDHMSNEQLLALHKELNRSPSKLVYKYLNEKVAGIK